MGNVKQSDIIRRLGFSRRPRAKPVPKQQSGTDPSHWASSGSLTSVSCNETRNSSITPSSSYSSSVNRRKPPLPPSHSVSKSPSEGFEHVLHVCQNSLDGRSPLVTQQPTTPKQNPLAQSTLVDTRNTLEREIVSSQTMTPETYPRRRLASFAGLGSTGILSLHTSWGALNLTQSQKDPKGSKLTVPDQASLESSSLRTSPKSSGRASPVTTVSPLDLHLVRNQMVVALERLKEMEEQVKIIPVLQIKISVLKEEKKHLSAVVKKLESQNLGCNIYKDLEGLSKERAYGAGSTVKYSKPEKDDKGQKDSAIKVGSWEHSTLSDRDQFKNAEMQLTINNNVAMGKEIVHSRSCCRDVAKLNVRSVEVGVTERMLGVISDNELELDIQQQTIQVLKDKVQTLEVELKEALLKAELCPETGAHTHAAKNSSSQPEMHSIATQTGMLTRTVGIGNHVQLVHAAVGEGAVQALNTVGGTCQIETSDVASGLDTPIEMWEIQKKVEKKDQCVGTQYLPTFSQGVGTSVSVCDVGIMTLGLIETLGKKKISSRTVGCGDCTIDVNVNVVKPLVSQGIITEPVRGIDIGVMITPQTMSQCTNTDVRSAHVFESNPITASMNTQDRHTNTVQIITRTPAVGDGKVSDQKVARKIHSIAVGTPVNLKEVTVAPCSPKVITRDTGVGLANINENFLVGLRTRNMACGPSCLPDPNKTRSIGVEVGDGRIRDVDGHTWMPVHLLQPNLYAQTEHGLDHYIDRMQRLLKEQQRLLTSSHSKPKNEVARQTQHLLDTQYGGNAFSFQMYFPPKNERICKQFSKIFHYIFRILVWMHLHRLVLFNVQYHINIISNILSTWARAFIKSQ